MGCSVSPGWVDVLLAVFFFSVLFGICQHLSIQLRQAAADARLKHQGPILFRITDEQAGKMSMKISTLNFLHLYSASFNLMSSIKAICL